MRQVRFWCPRRDNWVTKQELVKRPMVQMGLFDHDRRSPEERYADQLKDWMGVK